MPQHVGSVIIRYIDLTGYCSSLSGDTRRPLHVVDGVIEVPMLGHQCCNRETFGFIYRFPIYKTNRETHLRLRFARFALCSFISSFRAYDLISRIPLRNDTFVEGNET